MKRVFTLLTGIFLLCQTNNVSAQSGSPPGKISRSDLFRFLRNLTFGRSPDADQDTLSAGPSSFTLNRGHPVADSVLRKYCENVETARRRIYYISERAYRMSFQVRGIYVRDEVLFFQLLVANHSHLDYDIDSIRFFITDKQRPKKGPVKIIGLSPLLVYGNNRIIKGKDRQQCVIAFPRFTLPASKRLIMQVLEKNGGRNLQVQADNFALLRAREI